MTSKALEKNQKSIDIITGKNGNYKLYKNKLIGKGSFSSVYVGKMINGRDKVAIKKIDYTILKKYERDIIDRESEIISKLINHNNPSVNILSYYDIIKTHNSVFIIMELCTNGTFSSLLIKPMKEIYSRFYFKQIIEGLSTLKTLGILHGDIKPDNILITNNYSLLKLCDFGFSELLNEKKIKKNNVFDHILKGTPIYMAPEVMNMENLQASYSLKIQNDTNFFFARDIWSIGIIFYEMTHGFHPFRGSIDINSVRELLNGTGIDTEKKVSVDLSEDGYQLLRNMTRLNVATRNTIDDILTDQWLNSVHDANNENITINANGIALKDIFYRKNNDSVYTKCYKINVKTEEEINKTFLNNGIFDLIMKRHNMGINIRTNN
jgi:serine/threonine protein kinase